MNVFVTIKNVLEKRPLCCSCALFLLLTAILLFAPTIVKGTAIAVGLLFFVSCLLYGKYIPDTKFLFSCLAVFFLLTVVSSAVSLVAYDLSGKKSEDLALKEAEVTVVGYPTKTVYETDFSNCYIMKVQRLNGKPVLGLSILARFPADDAPALFEVVKTDGSLSLPENTDPSFDSVSYYRSKGVFAELHPQSTEFTGKKAITLARPLSAMTSFIKDHVDGHAGAHSAPLIKAVLFGDKGDLSKELKRDFKTLGLSHLLAVSGQHLSVLFALWSFLLIKLRIPLKVRCGLLIPLILLFCALCGFSPSVMRASVMLILYLISRMVDEEKDSVTSLLFSGALIVFFSPYSVLDTGFLLSFFSALGIIGSSSLRLRKKRKEKKIKSIAKSVGNALLVSVSAQIAVLPVICQTFGSFSLASVPATMIFTPLISLILYLSPFALLLFFVPGLSSLLFFLLELLSLAVIRLSNLAVYLKDGLVSTEHPFAAVFLFLLILCVSFLFLSKKKGVAIAITAGCYLLFCGLCFLYPRAEYGRIITDTDGKNDMFILYDRGESLIVDLSDGSKGCLDKTLSLLNKRSCDLTPDALLLTHYHQRHLNSFESFAAEYYPEHLYLCSPVTDEEQTIFKELCAAARERSVKVTVIEPQDSVTFGKYTLSSFERSYLARSTHPILSFTVDEGCHRFLYLSASALEGDLYPEEKILYFGVHGPVIKEPLPSYITDRFDLLFANEDIAESYGCSPGALSEEPTHRCFFSGQPIVFPERKEE